MFSIIFIPYHFDEHGWFFRYKNVYHMFNIFEIVCPYTFYKNKQCMFIYMVKEMNKLSQFFISDIVFRCKNIPETYILTVHEFTNHLYILHKNVNIQ